MKKKTAGKIVVCTVLLCFFTNILCLNAFARDASKRVLFNEEKALYVAEIIERLEDILEPQKDTITMDDIEYMIMQTNYLHEELFAFLFSPDGALVIESTDACASILVIAALYTLRGVTLVLSLLNTILRVTQNEPQTFLGVIWAAIQLIIKVVDVVINAPIAGANGLLSFIQYLSCLQSPEIS